MLLDIIQDQLKIIDIDMATVNAYCTNIKLESRFRDLQALTHEELFWQHPNQTAILKELSHLKHLYEEQVNLNASLHDLHEFIGLFDQDERELEAILKETRIIYSHVKKFKITLLLQGPNDQNNCFLNINSGAGGTEAQDWTSILLRMYLRFCEQQGFNANMVDYQEGDGAGLKSVTLFIKGKNAYGFLKNEHGIHRLVRVSPFDANKRRHTSFAGVMVTPEVGEVTFQIDPKDLRIDTYRSSGAGGQHVNKTESAIRITHIPTNIVVQCQIERSQIQNRETAMNMLKSKLAQKYQQEHEEKNLGAIEKKKIEWGSQIRSYVLHPYKMVKDHRTDYESMQPEVVLDGNIMDFIEINLVKNGTRN